ncbi:hypothetical protein LNW71_35155 [Streptomyces sp. RKAG290]|nr:hypothetical protein [Streptomyces sp. RKAG290]
MVCARANAWTNQVYVVNVNAGDPAGVGQSTVVDPEGIVRQQAGPGEEILVDVLDLDTVARVRRYGAGINRPWSQLARYGKSVKLPMYGGEAIHTPDWRRRHPVTTPPWKPSPMPASAAAAPIWHHRGPQGPPPGSPASDRRHRSRTNITAMPMAMAAWHAGPAASLPVSAAASGAGRRTVGVVMRPLSNAWDSQSSPSPTRATASRPAVH